MSINSYKDLVVWQKGINLVEDIYQLTKDFPRTEQLGLISQMRRAAISIPSNIAEGYGRRSIKEYKQFYIIAYGSCQELETQLIISKRLEFKLKEELLQKIENLILEINKMLYVMIYKTERKELKIDLPM